MDNIQDALYNWLTIKIVCMERPDDNAAIETEKMFYNMLVEQHKVSDLNIEKDDTMYNITYQKDGMTKKNRFPKDLVEVMINHINAEPEKYKNVPE